MVVYWEYAFLENSLLDGLLLYLALRCARAKVSALHLVFAAAIGGAEAVVFPLFTLPVWAAYLVKLLGGAAIVLLGVRRGTAKTYLVTGAAFFLMTFALGGLLTAVYSFFGAEYRAGEGYLIGGAPFVLVLSCAGCFVAAGTAAVRAFFRYRGVQQNLLPFVLSGGKGAIRGTGFSDSGNRLTFRGAPVCVVSAAAALALLKKGAREAGRMTVQTVNGSRESPVLQCDRLEITVGNRVIEHRGVFVTIGDLNTKDYQLLFHTSFTEAGNATDGHTRDMAEKDRGRRGGHTLSLRK